METLGFLTVDKLQLLMERLSCWSLASAMAVAVAHSLSAPAAAALPAAAPHSTKAARPLLVSHRNVRAALVANTVACTQWLFLAEPGDASPCCSTTTGERRWRPGVSSGAPPPLPTRSLTLPAHTLADLTCGVATRRSGSPLRAVSCHAVDATDLMESRSEDLDLLKLCLECCDLVELFLDTQDLVEAWRESRHQVEL